MNRRVSSAVLLLIAALAPVSVSAALIDISNVELTAFGSFSTQLQPVKADLDRKSAPLGSLTEAEVLIIAEGVAGMPFPNIPMSQTRPFASPSSIANGEFGVGVNGFFLQNSLPPHKLLASGSFTVSITNNSDSSITIPLIHFLIPAPTIQFFGVGDSTFPQGADPARDATATAVIDIVETLTLANGTKLETILVDYGLQVLRALPSTVLFPFPRRDGVGQVTRFEEPDGSFGFLLPELEGQFAVQLPAGASVEYGTHYTAEVSTGFGETGVFAAIGDPFNLSTGGGRFDIQVGDPLPPSSVPEPDTAILLGAGLAIAGLIRRRRAWHVA